MQDRSWKTYGVYTLFIAVAAGVVYGFFALNSERLRLEASLSDTENRLNQMSRKYDQEKNLTANLLRTKQSLEGLMRGMEAKVKQAEEDKAKILAEKEGLEAHYEKKSVELKKKVVLLTERIGQFKATQDKLVARYKEKVEVIHKNEQTIAQLTDNLNKTSYELKRTRKQLDTCGEHNDRLCTINEELVVMYKNKGLVSVISAAEPLTQLRKVEMEKMVQLYKSKIDENKEDAMVYKTTMDDREETLGGS